MQHSSSAIVKNLLSKTLRHQTQIQEFSPCHPFDVFINHRGIDTKRTIVGLLYQHFSSMGLHSFLDNKNMKPADRLFDRIDPAIRNCKVGIAVFSPSYCGSYFCLHELALMVKYRKRIIPIFCDVKPSELHVKEDLNCPEYELERFQMALEEAKYTVGLTFDSHKGDWSEFLTSASDAVFKNLLEVDAGAHAKGLKYFEQDHRKPACLL